MHLDKMKAGHNLIFLISQPRAGSTMMQRILGSHPQVHTTSESWVMLHPLYSMKTTGIETEYSSDHAVNGLRDFLSQIDNGPAEYLEKMRQMYGSLYDRLLEPTGKKYYLDKTPRYYFIVNELYELFPGAKFIILLRNPLAVLSSIIESKIKFDWLKLNRNKSDLLYAPDCLLKGIEKFGDTGLRLQYENVLSNPDRVIENVCDYLGVRFDKEMIEYGNSGLPRWQYGDQETVYEKTKPDDLHSDKWIRSLENPQVWRIMREYLDYLGEDRIIRMGYSFSELDAVLMKNRPQSDIDKTSVSLSALLDNPCDSLLEKKRLQEQIQQRDEQLRKKNEQLLQKNEQLLRKNEQLLLKNEKIRQRDMQLRQKDQQIQQKNKHIENIEALLKQEDQHMESSVAKIKQKD